MNYNYDLAYLRDRNQFEFPTPQELDKMDLIDIRRKLMRWCAKSQGAIGPCRACMKCEAGVRAVALYDGSEAPKASEPVVTKESNKEVAEEKGSKEEMTKENKKEKPVAEWYTKAVNSGDPVKWCMDNLGLSIQKAKKRIYMYEYNRFGARRTKQEENTGPVLSVKASTEDVSLVTAMETKMKLLTEKQQSCKAKIDELTTEYKRISDQLEAITMCIELLNEKTVS